MSGNSRPSALTKGAIANIADLNEDQTEKDQNTILQVLSSKELANGKIRQRFQFSDGSHKIIALLPYQTSEENLQLADFSIIKVSNFRVKVMKSRKIMILLSCPESVIPDFTSKIGEPIEDFGEKKDIKEWQIPAQDDMELDDADLEEAASPPQADPPVAEKYPKEAAP